MTSGTRLEGLLHVKSGHLVADDWPGQKLLYSLHRQSVLVLDRAQRIEQAPEGEQVRVNWRFVVINWVNLGQTPETLRLGKLRSRLLSKMNCIVDNT